eukprot:6469601-Amphidinium_carterae.2
MQANKTQKKLKTVRELKGTEKAKAKRNNKRMCTDQRKLEMWYGFVVPREDPQRSSVHPLLQLNSLT